MAIEYAPEGMQFEDWTPSEPAGIEYAPEGMQFEDWVPEAAPQAPARTGEQVLADLMPGMGFAEPGPAQPDTGAPEQQGFLPALGQDIGAAFGDVAKYLSAESAGMFQEGWEPSARALGTDIEAMTPEQRAAAAEDWQRRKEQFAQEYGQMRGYLPEPSTRQPANVLEEAVRAVVPMMGTGMMTPAGIYAQVAGNELEQIKRANPDIDDKKALDIARKSAAVQAAIEVGFGVSQLGTIYKGAKPFLSKLLGKGSEELAGKASSFARKLMASAPAKIAKVGFQEGSEEVLQNVVQAWREAAAKAVADDPDADVLSDKVFNDAVEIMGTDKWQQDTLRQFGIGALAGGVLGGGPIALGAASNYIQNRGAGEGRAPSQVEPGQQPGEAPVQQPEARVYVPPPDPTAAAIEKINSSVDAAVAEVTGQGPAAPPVTPQAPIQPQQQEPAAPTAEGQMTEADLARAQLEQISAALQEQNAPQQAMQGQGIPAEAVADQAVNAAAGPAPEGARVRPAAQITAQDRLAQAMLESVTGQTQTDKLSAAMQAAEQPAVSASESGEPGARTPTRTGPRAVAGAQSQEQAAGVGEKAKAETPMAIAPSEAVPGPSAPEGAAAAAERTWRQKIKDRNQITVEHAGMKPVTMKKGDKVTQIVDGEPQLITIRTVDARKGTINGKPAKMFFPKVKPGSKVEAQQKKIFSQEDMLPQATPQKGGAAAGQGLEAATGNEKVAADYVSGLRGVQKSDIDLVDKQAIPESVGGGESVTLQIPSSGETITVDIDKSGEVVSHETGSGAVSEGAEQAPAAAPAMAQEEGPAVATKVRQVKGVKSNEGVEAYNRAKVVSKSLDEAVKQGSISKESAGVISDILKQFPESYQQMIDVRVSEQSFAPTETQAGYTGVGKKAAETARVVSTMMPERKSGESRDVGKFVITMFKGSDVVDFIHEFGEFTYESLLTPEEKRMVSRLWKADKNYSTSTKKSEYFSDKFEQWWVKRQPMSKKLTEIFRRMLKAIKGIYKRVRGKVPPELQVLFEDIVTNGRDIQYQNKFFTDNDVVRLYFAGDKPGPKQIKDQGFRKNAKTGMSWDPSSTCPKQQAFIDYALKWVEDNGMQMKDLASADVLAGLWDEALAAGVDVPCSYCYVEGARRTAIALHEQGAKETGVLFAKASQVFREVPYVDYILKMKQADVDELNKRGGLRMFSFSDYVRSAHRVEVENMLQHAAQRGLSIKAITKNPEFVEDFAHTGITINLSIDKTRHGMPWATASKLKSEYPNVKVRATALNMEEFKEYAELSYGGHEQFVDVITPYHHEDKTQPIPDGMEDMTWNRVKGKQLNAYAKSVPGLIERVCCQEGGKCFNKRTQTQCATNCGAKAGNLTIPRFDDIRFRQPESIKMRTAKNPGRQPKHTEKKKWPKDFPNVTTHTTLNKLREHPRYEEAKAGDPEAAVDVVVDLAKDEKIVSMAKKHPNAILAVPHAVEATGKNAIPSTLASYIHDKTGLQVDLNIVQSNRPRRTDKNGEERLVARPMFDGPVIKGAEYILVDDAVGSGGTFAEMRNFIEVNGGKVVDTMALTGGLFSNKLAIRPSTISELNNKFGRKNLADFLKDIELAKGPEYLTEKEGRFILRQKSLESLRDRIPSQRSQEPAQKDDGAVKTPTSVTAATTTPASTTLYSGLAAIPTRVLGGAASGAMAGGAVGGPVGMAVGAGLGTISELGGISKAWDSEVAKRIRGGLEKAPVLGRGIKAVRRALDTKYRGELKDTPDYLREWRRTRLEVQKAQDYAIDLGNRLSSLPEDAQMRVGEAIRGEIGVGDLQNSNERALATESVQILMTLGQRAVDMGLLSEEAYFTNIGRYMPRLYTSKEYQGLLDKYGIKKPARLDLSRFKRRKDIPEEIRKQMGEILTPGYPVAKGIMQIAHDVELSYMFQRIAKNPDWAFREDPEPAIVNAVKDAVDVLKQSGLDLQGAIDIVKQKAPDLDIFIKTTKGGRDTVQVKNIGSAPADWEQLPKSKKLGALSEAFVHPEIFNDINDSIRKPEEWEKLWSKALGAWKFGKVILSPKTHVRNMLSNSLLMHMGGLPLYKQAPYLLESARELKNKGKIWEEARDQGLFGSTFTQGELRELFDLAESQMSGVKAGSMGDAITAYGKITLGLRSGMRKAAKAYELEEQWGKLALYSYGRRSLGLSEEAAADYANKWLFDYGDLTRFQSKYRRSPLGAPFATFTFKVVPRVLETWIKYPHRMLLPMAIINGLGYAAAKYLGDDKEREEAKKKMRPEWMQGSFMGVPNFQRIPVTDETGREYWLNLSYIVPWGDFGESGGALGIPGGLMPLSQPLIKEAWQQGANYDLFWSEKIVKDKNIEGLSKTDRIWQEVRIRGAHAIQTFSPTPVMDTMKAVAAYRNLPDYRGRYRPKSIVVADIVAGFKAYPVDYTDEELRKISKYHPKSGSVARDLMRELKTNLTKINAMAEKNDDYSALEERNEEIYNQLAGLSQELLKWSEVYSATQKKVSPRKRNWMQTIKERVQ